MTIRKTFKKAIEKGRILIRVEPDPFPSAPGVSEHDGSVIVSEAARRLYDDIEFYGPGAEAANARREAEITRRDARILARIPAKEKAIAKAEDPHDAPKKKRRLSKRGRLEKKAIALRAEIERLKKK
jgi:hypothetical protein